jgi:hypothetical protein
MWGGVLRHEFLQQNAGDKLHRGETGRYDG